MVVLFQFYHSIGREYSYGADGGIIASRPKDVIGVKFRETIFMGNTYLSPSQIRDVISNLEVLFTGTNYNMLEQWVFSLLFMNLSNCNHFSNEFCRIITGKQIPSHINRCATIAGWFTRMASNVVSNVTEFVENLDIPLPHLVDERNREEQEKEKRPKDTNTNPSSK